MMLYGVHMHDRGAAQAVFAGEWTDYTLAMVALQGTKAYLVPAQSSASTFARVVRPADELLEARMEHLYRWVFAKKTHVSSSTKGLGVRRARGKWSYSGRRPWSATSMDPEIVWRGSLGSSPGSVAFTRLRL